MQRTLVLDTKETSASLWVPNRQTHRCDSTNPKPLTVTTVPPNAGPDDGFNSAKDCSPEKNQNHNPESRRGEDDTST